MPAPAGPSFPVFFSATALVLLAPLELPAADTRDEVKQAIRTGFPRYDPAVYEKAQAERAARSAPRNTPAPLPETKPAASAAPVAPAAPSPDGKILELPTLTIRADRDPPKSLPRTSAPKPLKNVPPETMKLDSGEVIMMESASGRDARRIKNHLSPLTQSLNSKKNQAALARQAEFEMQRSAQMNEIAALIELQIALGGDPADIKQIRAEYLKLYYSGPK